MPLPDIPAIVGGLQQRFLRTSTGDVQEVVLVDPSSGSTYAATGTGSSSAVTIADGAAATVGTTTDASSASTLVGLLKNIKAALAGILSVKIDQTTPGTTNGVQLSAALPAGTNLLGKVWIDQTTPGTTNAVESNHYGTPSAGASVTVGIGSTAVLAANANRKFLALCNDSANTIYVDLSGATAALSKGIRLSATGGAVLLDRYVPTSAITAIASGAGSVLTVQEG